MIKLIGENPDEFSTHCFRRGEGGSSWVFAAEVPTKLIQLYGNWRSDAYKKYLKLNLEGCYDSVVYLVYLWNCSDSVVFLVYLWNCSDSGISGISLELF